MAVIDKPELTESDRRILAGVLDTPGVAGVLLCISQREMLSAIFQQQAALRRHDSVVDAYRLAGKIEVWEALTQLLRNESRIKPGA